MALREYTAEVKDGLLLELPIEAGELHLKPGDKVTVKLDEVEPILSVSHSHKRPSALGKYAFVAGGSEEFAREKQAEIDREDRTR